MRLNESHIAILCQHRELLELSYTELVAMVGKCTQEVESRNPTLKRHVTIPPNEWYVVVDIAVDVVELTRRKELTQARRCNNGIIQETCTGMLHETFWYATV